MGRHARTPSRHIATVSASTAMASASGPPTASASTSYRQISHNPQLHRNASLSSSMSIHSWRCSLHCLLSQFSSMFDELSASTDVIFQIDDVTESTLQSSSDWNRKRILNLLMLLGPVAVIGSTTGMLGEAFCFLLSGLALIPCAERYVSACSIL